MSTPYVYYKCEDNLATSVVLDDSANLNGTASTNTNNLSVSGKLNLGFEFNGTDERISLNGSSLPLGANPRTISCWIKYTVNDSVYRNIFNYGITSSNNQLFSLYIYQGKIGFTQWGAGIEPASLYNDGNWHFVSVVYDGTTAYLRVDTTTTSSAMTVNTPTGSTAYIAYSLYLRSYLTCTIDNFQIYNEALSDTILNVLYNNGNGTEHVLYSSDILIDGTSYASSYYSAGYESDKVVDNNLTTRWSSVIDESSSWWKYDLGSGITKTVNILSILGHYHPSYGLFIKNFILKGSNDNSNWTTIYSGVCTNTGNGDGVSTLNSIWQTFTFSNSTAYRYYKLDEMNDHYTSVITISVIEFEMIDILPTEETIDISDIVTLQDSWLLQTNPEQAQIVDTVTLSDSWFVATNPTFLDITDTITLNDSWLIDRTGTFKTKFLTKLYTTLPVLNTYFTDLRTIFNSTKKYATKLYTQFSTKNIYKTDLRVRVTPIDEVVVGTLDDFLVKLDGVTLADVDYNTLNITYNLNNTPSTADFVLARRHDNLDVMLNGSPSIITAENKIEVFDGARKLFTGYISEINADSATDTVRIVAADCRLKLSRASMELKYGGAWQADANHNGIPDDEDETNDKSFDEPAYIKFEKNISTAFREVMTSVGSLVSGYDSLPFSGSFVPEYVKIEKDYASLIDDLIRQTANCNWYIDENERLRFQKIGSGAIKALPLASLNAKRHPYDLILNNVQLNKITSNYTKSLIVKRGKDIIQHWSTRTFAGWINTDFFTFMKTLKEKTSFVFHSVRNQNPIYYTGVNGTAISYYVYGSWRSYPEIIIQWEDTNASYNLPDITVGSGLPKKTLHLTSYGKKVSNLHYAELIKSGENPNNSPANPPNSDKSYFCEIRDDNYDNSSFLLDLANFELSQNNKMQSSANLSMLLDAYEYYNISFSDLINLSNTIQSGIYSNNNGFPLNIDNVRINCATRTVDLNLTNSGKSWYAKTGSCLKNYSQPKVTYLYPKVIWTVVTEQSGTFTTE